MHGVFCFFPSLDALWYIIRAAMIAHEIHIWKSLFCRFLGGPTWTRTRDRPVMSRML